jgi:hypothetical protein
MMPTLTDAEQLEVANRVLDTLPAVLVNHWRRGTTSRALPVTDPAYVYAQQPVIRGASSRGLRVNSTRGPRKLEPELVEKLHTLLETGKSACEIALLVGVSSRTVERYRTTYNPIRKAS